MRCYVTMDFVESDLNFEQVLKNISKRYLLLKVVRNSGHGEADDFAASGAKIFSKKSLGGDWRSALRASNCDNDRDDDDNDSNDNCDIDRDDDNNDSNSHNDSNSDNHSDSDDNSKSNGNDINNGNNSNYRDSDNSDSHSNCNINSISINSNDIFSWAERKNLEESKTGFWRSSEIFDRQNSPTPPLRPLNPLDH